MVFELLVSLFRLECHEKLIPTDRQKLKYVPENLMKWVEETRARMTEEMKKEINIFFNFESYLGLTLCQLIWENRCFGDAQEFLSFLEGYPAKELIKCFFNTGYGQDDMLEGIDDIQVAKSFLERSSLPEEERWKLLYFCSTPEETKRRFIDLLRNFYNTIFKENIEALQKYHRESIRDIERKLGDDPYENFKKLIKFDEKNECIKDQIILMPSYYYNTSSLFSYNEEKETLIYIYGTTIPDMEFTDDISAEKIIEAIKVLSDENRIKTIEILNTSQCYGYELSQKLGLSSSTMSHHLSLLGSIGVISSVREENKVYYRVEKDNIRKLLKQFEEMLT